MGGLPLQGIRKVIEGYSEVFGWIWGYSAHFEHPTMWQLTGMLHVRIRPSTTWYNIKGVYQELWWLSGAWGVPPGRQGGSSERRLLEFYRDRLGKFFVYASSFILLARTCVHASSFIFLARVRVCFIALVEGIRHHSFGPCLQLGEPSERDGPLDYPIDPCLSST